MVNFTKTQSEYYTLPNKVEVVNFFTDVTDFVNEHKFNSLKTL